MENDYSIIKWEGLNWLLELMENVLSTLYFIMLMSWLPPGIEILSEYIRSRWRFLIRKYAYSQRNAFNCSKNKELLQKVEQVNKSKLTPQYYYYLLNITRKLTEWNSYTNETNRRQTSLREAYLYTHGDLLSKSIFKRVPKSLFFSASLLASISFSTY